MLAGGERRFTWATYSFFCGEKNPRLAVYDPRRKYTARVVFQGYRVINQDWEAVMFQELGNAPATMEASRSIDCYGCLLGHIEEKSDARQAYIQAYLKGTPTWACLPREQWAGAWQHMRRPVVPLLRAMCGHPDSGAYWEERRNESVEAKGFVAIVKSSWPGTYYHPRLRLMLVIVVDDGALEAPHFGDESSRLW